MQVWGNKEKAMELLQQCLEQREWQLVFLKVEAFWDNLRDDPNLLNCWKRWGLKNDWQTILYYKIT